MGKGEHPELVHTLPSSGLKRALYWMSIGACRRCGSTRFWRSPGGQVLCGYCYPKPKGA